MAYLTLIKHLMLLPVVLRYSMGSTGLVYKKKKLLEDILTGVVSGFFADSANTYQDPPFELLKLLPMCKCNDWSKVEKTAHKCFFFMHFCLAF